MRKLFTFLFAALMSVGMWADSGTCGPNLTWNLTGGALTISGTGVMDDFNPSSNNLAPWFSSRESITSVTITDGVTSIGMGAFYVCTSLSSVTIPNSVTSIRPAAFMRCTSLSSVTIPNSVTSIGASAFIECSNLETVTILAESLESYGTDAFYNTHADLKIYVPAGSVDTYKAGWADYEDKIEAIPAPTPTEVVLTANEDPQNQGVWYSTFFDSANKYALPNDGTEAYAAEVSGSTMYLHLIAENDDVLPAKTAVILKANSGSITLTPTDASAVTVSATNNLHGVDEETDVPTGDHHIYVLSGEGGVVGFYAYTGAKLGAHKAYIDLDAEGAAKAPRRLVFHTDEEQGIEDVQNAVQSTKLIENGQLVIIKNGIRYNAQGQIVK